MDAEKSKEFLLKQLEERIKQESKGASSKDDEAKKESNDKTTYESKKYSLDEYEQLMLDAIKWRMDSFEKTKTLLGYEEKNIENMKRDLITRFAMRNNIDFSKYMISIDSQNRTALVKRKDNEADS